MTHTFHPTVLREYDIRGITGETLSAEDARAVGASFGTMLVEGGARDVAVGYDGRLTSPELEAAVVDGLASTGLEVIRVGRGPTPMLYFAVWHLETGGGIMVTGSHNPPAHNGFKMMKGRKAFYGDDIKRLGKIAAAGAWEAGPAPGAVRQVSVMDAYVAKLADAYNGAKDLTVAWDAGNAAAGEAMELLTAKLPGTHILLNAEIDGTFPNHHPDPTEAKNLVQLQEAVAANSCDLGIAFDGDGDRIGVVDGEGAILWADQMLAVLAAEVLEENPGATIIADVKASQVLFDEVARLGGTPLMWKTGHSLIKSKMAETGAPLAGEMSGHIFYADRYYGFDDALYAAVRLIGILSRGSESLADIRKRLPQVCNTPEIRIECPEDRKFAAIEETRARLAQAGANVDGIDGVRVLTSDGWWLLRASNTQAVLVARCEAADEAGLGRLKAEVAAQLEAAGIPAEL